MKKIFTCILILLLATGLFAQNKPYRVGTTASSFLELGIGSAGVSMGEAYVSAVRDVTSIYWNPSGLAYMNSNEVQFMYRPWIAGIKTTFAGGAVPIPGIGTLALGMSAMDFGSTEITTMEMQEGTGEMFSAMDYANSLSYAIKTAPWFGFAVVFENKRLLYVSLKCSRKESSHTMSHNK